MDSDSNVCCVIKVAGNVQGVGFRPFLFRLAEKHSLSGIVRNSLIGVELEVEGPRLFVEAFLGDLRRNPPPLATIMGLSHDFGEPRGHDGFSIDVSKADGVRTALVPPDVGVCEDCLEELFDPGDRRYLHPFIGCTNCGPRFTMVRDLPFDRRNTSMSCFPMCPACQREYGESTSRRFHCQTNGCWECGPRLWLQSDSDVESTSESRSKDLQKTAIDRAVRMLQQGGVVAVKGLGGFHLACDATNSDAVKMLRRRKNRDAKPFALMVPDLETARRLCHLDHGTEQLLSSSERPIVIVPRRESELLSGEVTRGGRWLGVMLPHTPLHFLLLMDAGMRPRFHALVMTSGNVTDEPIVTGNEEALQKLEHLADAFLLHDREIVTRADDSIVRCELPSVPVPGDAASSRSTKTLIRRARGFVPVPISLDRDLNEVLAVGGHLKNALAVSRGNQVFLSQHIGDLGNLEALESFKQVAEHLQRVLGVRPKVVAHDMHPDYLSTRYVQQLEDVQLVSVQHHHAHIASCMAEHRLQGSVIGLVLDGSGYGTDGCVWGGEVLIADYLGFQRAAHLRNIPLPGNEQAVKEPWRMALSYLNLTYGEAFWDLPIPLLEKIDRSAGEILLRAMRRNFNSPMTSSCGRLFDAVAALIGLRQINAYEGQAAMELEMAIGSYSSSAQCAFSQEPLVRCGDEQDSKSAQASGQPLILNQLPLIQMVVDDILEQRPLADICRRFHNGLSQLLATAVERVAESSGVRQVVLSGGCLQNEYLKHELTQRIGGLGLPVFSHVRVPPNDGGLALGQIMVASCKSTFQAGR